MAVVEGNRTTTTNDAQVEAEIRSAFRERHGFWPRYLDAESARAAVEQLVAEVNEHREQLAGQARELADELDWRPQPSPVEVARSTALDRSVFSAFDEFNRGMARLRDAMNAFGQARQDEYTWQGDADLVDAVARFPAGDAQALHDKTPRMWRDASLNVAGWFVRWWEDDNGEGPGYITSRHFDEDEARAELSRHQRAGAGAAS